jgi:hypothetical protein
MTAMFSDLPSIQGDPFHADSMRGEAHKADSRAADGDNPDVFETVFQWH